MNRNTVTFECPRCASGVRLAKTAVRTASFLCPVCLEGEIARVSAGRAGGVKLGGTVLRAPLSAATGSRTEHS
jgi:predicted RNA-binding Zn-ribbon protein involved in translation (DUF1610 family)